MSPQVLHLWIPLGGAVLALLCLFGALHAGRKRRLIADIPTVKTSGVFIGLVELKGTAETERPLTSYLAASTCVLYDWSVQEHWSRTVTETYTDKDGKTRTRTKTESGWTMVASGGEHPPFFLKDDAGVIRVWPEGAKIEPVQVFHRECNRMDPLYYGKGPAGAVAHSDHRRLFTETVIPLHAPLYLIGQAREREDVVAAEIARDKVAPIFIISTRSEEKVAKSFRVASVVWCILGLMLAVGGSLVSDLNREAADPAGMPRALLAGLGYIGAGVLCWLWSTWNGLIELRNRVKQGWSLIDVQLKRRADLIPGLVDVVKGLRDHESTVQGELAALRGQMGAPAQAQGVHALLGVVAERYPELKTQESFLKLQRTLSQTEERIAMARDYYTGICGAFNTRIEQFPSSVLAAIGRLKAAKFFESEGFERAVVAVNLQ